MKENCHTDSTKKNCKTCLENKEILPGSFHFAGTLEHPIEIPEGKGFSGLDDMIIGQMKQPVSQGKESSEYTQTCPKEGTTHMGCGICSPIKIGSDLDSLREKHKMEWLELGKSHGAELERTRILNLIESKKKEVPEIYIDDFETSLNEKRREKERAIAHNAALTSLAEEILSQEKPSK